MTQPPVVDILFRAILTGDQAALGDLETHRAAECTDLRALISTDQAGAVALDLELGATSSIYVTPLSAVVNVVVASLQATCFSSPGCMRSGLSQTSSFNSQLRVDRDQRRGLRCLASA